MFNSDQQKEQGRRTCWKNQPYAGDLVECNSLGPESYWWDHRARAGLKNLEITAIKCDSSRDGRPCRLRVILANIQNPTERYTWYLHTNPTKSKPSFLPTFLSLCGVDDEDECQMICECGTGWRKFIGTKLKAKLRVCHGSMWFEDFRFWPKQD